MTRFAPSTDELLGRICVVTGSAGGIGREVALILAKAGGRIALIDRDQSGARETSGLIAAHGGHALVVDCDTADPDSVETAHAIVAQQLGEVDILVNNAAIRRPGTLASLSLADWNAVIAVNLTGYFLCSQVFSRGMRERGRGALVHISSVCAEMALPMAGAYSVAKAGVTMLSRQLALEWGPVGIRSNAVHPGMISTPRTDAIYERPGVRDQRSAILPSRRIGTPVDIAQTVLFLASPRSDYINGAELVVDGGMTRNLMSFVPST